MRRGESKAKGLKRGGRIRSARTKAKGRAEPKDTSSAELAEKLAAKIINATLFEKLNFNFIRDIAPVASIVRTFYVMEVNPAIPVETVPEFIAYANRNPGKINFASPGIGTPQHVCGELFKMMNAGTARNYKRRN
jgi:tripartite-type tricarboxylate transporter receptor subunit TctC